MKIKWNNIVAMLMAIVLLVVLLNSPQLLSVTLENLRGIGPGHTAGEQVTGVITLGLIGLTLVGIVRLMTNHDSRE